MQPVVRALHLLQAISRSGTGATLGELGEMLGIPLPSLHRLLAVLSAEGFVSRSPTTRRYLVGPSLRELASAGGGGHGSALVRPHPAMQKASEITGETVFLTELYGGRAVCVALVEGRHPLRLFVHIGKEMPLHAAASARTLLADMPDEQLVALLDSRPLTAFTDDTPSTSDQVLAHVRTIRERGYDICQDELDDDVWAFSVPVRNGAGGIAASITLAAPLGRMSADGRREVAREAVVEAAAALSRSLGHVPDSAGEGV